MPALTRERANAFAREHPLAAWGLSWLALVGLVGAALALALLVDADGTLSFLWTDVVGPWVAEATHRSSATWNGHVATTGYTLGLEAVYVGLILFAMLSAGLLIARPIEQPFARGLIYAITPAAMAGTVVRVLEDGLVFCRPGTAMATGGCQASPLAYLAISPGNFSIIYAAVCVIAGLLAATRDASPRRQRARVRVLLAGQAALVLVLLALGRDWVGVWLPWSVVLFALGDPVYATLRDREWRHVEAGILATTLAWLAIALAHLVAWLVDPLTATTLTLAYPAWVLVATLVATGGVWLAARWLTPHVGRAAAVASGLGAWIVGSHLFDAFATLFAVCTPTSGLCQGASFTGLALAGYGEKHPVSEALLGVWDGWAFPLVKLVVPAAFLIAAAPYLGDEDTEHRIGVYLLIIWYAGLVPGVRDVVRGMMGI